MKVQKHTQIAQLRAAILGSVLIILGTMAFPAPTRAEELVSGPTVGGSPPCGPYFTTISGELSGNPDLTIFTNDLESYVPNVGGACQIVTIYTLLNIPDPQQGNTQNASKLTPQQLQQRILNNLKMPPNSPVSFPHSKPRPPSSSPTVVPGVKLERGTQMVVGWALQRRPRP